MSGPNDLPDKLVSSQTEAPPILFPELMKPPSSNVAPPDTHSVKAEPAKTPAMTPDELARAATAMAGDGGAIPLTPKDMEDPGVRETAAAALGYELTALLGLADIALYGVYRSIKVAKAAGELADDLMADGAGLARSVHEPVAGGPPAEVSAPAPKPIRLDLPEPEVHPTADIHPSAQLGRGVKIGPDTVIKEDVVVGDETCIGLDGGHYVKGPGGVQIGPRTRIGSGVDIDRYTTIGSDVKIGDKVAIGSHLEGNTIEDGVQLGDKLNIFGSRIGSNSKIGLGPDPVDPAFRYESAPPYLATRSDVNRYDPTPERISLHGGWRKWGNLSLKRIPPNTIVPRDALPDGIPWAE